MYNGLLHAHSGLRWLVLFFIIWALIQAISGFFGKRDYTKTDRISALLALNFCHIQFLVGLILYFISPKVAFAEGMMKNDVLRFFTMEHVLMMVIGIALISIGFSSAKKLEEAVAKHKKVMIFYSIGLLIILAGIPWPFRNLGAGWF